MEPIARNARCSVSRPQNTACLRRGLWNTEWGYSTAAPPNDKENETVSPDQQSVYILRRLLEARALGVMSFYYVFRDDGGDLHKAWQNFGLIDINLKPKPAYYALQRFTKMFAKLDGDGTAGGFDLADHSSFSRCYSYHAINAPGKWVACWRAVPWPGLRESVPTQIRLALPPGDKSIHAIETTLDDGVERSLEIRTDPSGQRFCVPHYNAAPVVIHFFN